MPLLLPRQDYYCPDGWVLRGDECYRSNWDAYGRWIVVAGVIIAGTFIFFVFACITARRRRAAGFAPYRGTGWAGGRAPAGHGPAQYAGAQPPYGSSQYNNPQQPPNPAPPVYAAPPNQTYYGNGDGNHGYFGGQQSGVELQQPQGAYQPQRGGESVYNPPQGPPPGKGGDGFIR